MSGIPLIKQADLLDTAKDAIWDSDDGPMENLFRLGENYLIIFRGGPFAILLIMLKALNLSLARVGRMIDQSNGLSGLTDIGGLNPEKTAQKITDQLLPIARQQSGAGLGSPVGPEWSKNGDFVDEMHKTAILGVGRASMLTIFAAGIGWVIKQALDPKSTLATIIRGAMAFGIDARNDENDGDPVSGSAKTAPATKKTPKVQLEETVDKILGAP